MLDKSSTEPEALTNRDEHRMSNPVRGKSSTYVYGEEHMWALSSLTQAPLPLRSSLTSLSPHRRPGGLGISTEGEKFGGSFYFFSFSIKRLFHCWLVPQILSTALLPLLHVAGKMTHICSESKQMHVHACTKDVILLTQPNTQQVETLTPKG